MQNFVESLTPSLSEYSWSVTTFWIFILSLFSFSINFFVRRLLLQGACKVLALIDQEQGTEVRQVISRLANIAPALVFSLWISFVPGLSSLLAKVIYNIANAFILLSSALALSSLLSFVNSYYRHRPEAKFHSIVGIVQIAKIILFFITAFLILAILIDRSPFILFSGLGAMAAVLILVFQDTLLSFVAGLQISSTDMLRVGDWLEISNLGADGDVIEIALHSVKIRNFDKTITIVPIRKLVTDSFKNWRGMQESGGRRIKRSLYIDQASIRFLNEQDEENIKIYRQMSSYLQNRQQEIKEWNENLAKTPATASATRRLTNIGTFRAYVEAYLETHPSIHKNMTKMVRQLAPTAEGLPLEIYCFTNTILWIDYENIQSDIFDHLYSVLSDFGLRIFQNPSSNDIQHFCYKLTNP